MAYGQQRFRLNASYILILMNVVFFAIQTFYPAFTDMFILVSKEVLAHPWTLLTSMFLHGSPMHLLFNMYALFIFGPLIESRIGTSRFTLAYFAAGLLAGITSLFFYDSVLGASGAIMGILGLTIMLLPDMKVLFFFFIPMSMRTAGIIFAAIDIVGLVVPTHIASAAHLGGLAVGLLYGWYLVKNRNTVQKAFVEKPVVKKPRGGKGDTSNIEMTEDEMREYLRSGRL